MFSLVYSLVVWCVQAKKKNVSNTLQLPTSRVLQGKIHCYTIQDPQVPRKDILQKTHAPDQSQNQCSEQVSASSPNVNSNTMVIKLGMETSLRTQASYWSGWRLCSKSASLGPRS